jgi:hypothetical protein
VWNLPNKVQYRLGDFVCQIVNSNQGWNISFWHKHICKRLTPPRTASGHNETVQLEQRPNVAVMRWRGLILIQASFAASYSAAVGWLYLNNPPQGGHLDEFLYAPT